MELSIFATGFNEAQETVLKSAAQLDSCEGVKVKHIDHVSTLNILANDGLNLLLMSIEKQEEIAELKKLEQDKLHYIFPVFIHGPSLRFYKEDECSNISAVNFIRRDFLTLESLERIILTARLAYSFNQEHANVCKQLNRHNRFITLGEISTQVAHEMNNILHGVSLTASIIHKKNKMNRDITPLLAKLQAFTQKGQGVARHVLDLARDRHDLLKPLNLTRFLTDLFPILKISISPRVHVTLTNASEDLWVMGHEGHLTLALINMIRNAAHATEDCGTIAIDLVSSSKNVVLSIKDDGHGIEEKIIEKIFDPFFTTKREKIGTGIGLDFVKKIMKCHRGEVTVDSKVGEGTTFCLSFPLMDKEQIKDQESRESTSNVEPLSFLVIDQDQDVLSLLKIVIESEGHLFKGFHDTTMASEYLNDDRQLIDVVICEDFDDNDSGLKFLQDIKSKSDHYRLILSTAKINPALEKGILNLHKPYNYKDIEKLVKKV